MSAKYSHNDYDNLKYSNLVDTPFYQSTPENSLFPPPGSKFMITEITEDFMISESGEFMLTEP